MSPARSMLWCWLFAVAACTKPAPPAPPEAQAPAATNRIDVPEAVRRNLGIEFVRVERRRVAETLRVPGHFELLPAARVEYRAPVAGRVSVLVRPLQVVQQGDLLCRIDSPQWRTMQRDLGEITTAVRIAQAKIEALQPVVAALRVHEASLEEAIAVMAGNIGVLEQARSDVGGQARELAAARVAHAQARAELAEGTEKHAETEAMLAELQATLLAGRDRFDLALAAASAIASMTTAQLLAPQEGAAGELPAWRGLAAIEVRAAAPGVIDKLPVATGGWVETGDLALSTADPGMVRFRARGLQSDLPRLRAGLPAQVVPLRADADAAVLPRVPGTLALGIDADPLQRTLDLFLLPGAAADWARPGIAAFLEIETRGSGAAELAVPLSSVLQDGLQRVLFRRDPADPDKVIRIEADLGLDDGRFVEVKSGLRDGDEVVLAGAYELMLASSGSVAKGGHFHADGTFHADGK